MKVDEQTVTLKMDGRMNLLPHAITIIPIKDENVHTLCSWRYEPPYHVYNLDPNPNEETMAYYLNPINAYHVMLDEQGEVIGFCSFGPDGQVPGGDYSTPALDIGMGMRPDLTGKGHGDALRDAAIGFARQTFAPQRLRVTIADFNQRAKRVWEKVGFRPVQRFENDFNGLEFVVYELALE